MSPPSPAESTGSSPEGRRAQLLRELAPAGLLQTFLAEQVARSMDRLARVDAREAPDGPADPAWLRDQARAERSFYRALTEFRRLVKADAKAARAASTTHVDGRESAAVEGPHAGHPASGPEEFAPLAQYSERGAGGEGLAPIPSPTEARRPSPQPSPGVPGEGVRGAEFHARSRPEGLGTCARAGAAATIILMSQVGGGMVR